MRRKRRRKSCTRIWRFRCGRGRSLCYYPEWIPGEHMPDGPIIEVAGMKFSAGGKAIPWRRDLVEMFSIHLDVPAGVSTLDADFDFLLAAASTGFSAGGSATANLDVLSWNQVLLYPQGLPAKDYTFVATCGCLRDGNSGPRCRSPSKMATRLSLRRRR